MIQPPEIQTPLQTVIDDYEVRVESKFSPTKDFYESIGINRIRFWQIVKGKKEPLISEAAKLSDFFSIPLESLVTSKAVSQ